MTPNQEYSPAEIKKAFREKAKEHHPDKHHGEKDLVVHEKAFLKCSHAYRMLTDPAYRRSEETSKASPFETDLNVRMTIPVKFEDCFFGRPFTISVGRIELAEDNTPKVKEEQEIICITVNLPAGSMNGHEYYSEKNGLKKNDEYGDLILKFMPTSHVRFQVKDLDVIAREELPLDLMIRGGEIDVHTMYGIRTLKVPAGTKPGDELPIKRCGIKEKGKHIIVVSPLFPSKDDLKGEHWDGLKINWDIEIEEDEEEIALREMHERMRQRHDVRIFYTQGGA